MVEFQVISKDGQIITAPARPIGNFESVTKENERKISLRKLPSRSYTSKNVMKTQQEKNFNQIEAMKGAMTPAFRGENNSILIPVQQ